MYTHLKLYLKRHEIIYMIDKLIEKRKELEQNIEEDKAVGKDVSKKEQVLIELDKDFFSYYSQLRSEKS